ncbi:MAG: PEP-CTERM sorting domain-containing protein, partial [Planctomycetota bacterium]
AQFHQDTVLDTGLIDGDDAEKVFLPYSRTYRPSEGPAHVTVPSGVDPGDDSGDGRVVTYGAGTINRVAVDGSTISNDDSVRRPLDFDSTLHFVMGNLAVKEIQVLTTTGAFADTAVTGTANATDALTDQNLVVPAVKLVDGDRDGIIMYKTTFEFGVTEGSNPHYDYNRDGEIHDAGLVSDPTDPRYDSDHAKSDRPFLAIYESTAVDPIDLASPTWTNADADTSGSHVDNYWVGNPFSPVDADGTGGLYARGDDGDAGVPESDPDITDTTGFDGEPLLVGELKDLYFLTVVNLQKRARSNQFMVTKGIFDLEVTDGRLFDWYFAPEHASRTNPDFYPYRGMLNAAMMFDFRPWMSSATEDFNYFDGGLLILAGQPIPEPGAGLLLLGSLAGLAVRRRRRK